MKILVPYSDLVNLKFVFQAMQMTEVRTDTHKRYWISVFAKEKFKLPPLNEQNRIVDKIEELFSDLDNGIQNLNLAQNQLKVYRQALLKHAFEGKLTEQWRKENNPEPAEKLLKRIKEERQKHYEQELVDWEEAVKQWEKDGKRWKKPKKPRPLEISTKEMNLIEMSIPKNWVKTTISEIYSSLTDYHSNGSYQSLKEIVKLYDKEEYALMVRATNFEKDDFNDDVKYIDETAYNFLKKSKLYGEELLIGKIGNAGKVYFMPVLNRPASLAMNLFSLSFQGLDNKFIYRQMISPRLSKEIESHVKGVGNPTIDKISIRSLNIALPSIDEQNEINSILDSQFSIIENLEHTIEASFKKSNALRQSILKKAFDGKLVVQDLNDESAWELLKRIQKEKLIHEWEKKQEKKLVPKTRKKMSKSLSIEEVLKTSNKPMLAKEVWQQSKHKDNIEDFYAELKKIQDKVKEVKKGTESLLSLAK